MAGHGVDEDKRATLRRFAALGAATSLAGVLDHSEEESDVREAILGYLSATPGAHLSKVRDDLGLGTGETQHHLRRLLEAGAIESYRDGDYRRFFPADRFSSFEQVALGYLRRETPRGMVIELLSDPDAGVADLAAALDVAGPTVSKHAAALEDVGLLDREDGYALARPETMLVLLVRYADSFDEDAVAFATEAATHISVDGT
jgi:predicted transcriptional regulator